MGKKTPPPHGDEAHQSHGGQKLKLERGTANYAPTRRARNCRRESRRTSHQILKGKTGKGLAKCTQASETGPGTQRPPA